MGRYVLVATLLMVGCKSDPVASPSAMPSPARSASAGKALAAASPARRASAGKVPVADEPIRPVYARTDLAPDPRAVELCGALHDLPAQRRAACCARKHPGYLATGECVRSLTEALADNAVRLAPAEVRACAAAMAEAHAGCDWVGPVSPMLPSACASLLRGTRQEGELCRSSLECAAGQRCAGAGPTEAGRCAAPAPTGSRCRTAVDPLAAVTRQTGIETEHPECDGYCVRGRCAPAKALGAACTSSVQCGPQAHCAGRVCTAGATAALGAACTSGGCAAGARCVEGQCVAPKARGAACRSALECAGACVEGVCEASCAATLSWKTAAALR